MMKSDIFCPEVNVFLPTKLELLMIGVTVSNIISTFDAVILENKCSCFRKT